MKSPDAACYAYGMSFARQFLAEACAIAERLDAGQIERAVALLAAVRDSGGRLFVLGVGGSAANASHAVNDFRKLAGMEAYAPTDNVSELTARTNDEGWAGVFEGWLRVSRCRQGDAVLVLSVGGGDAGRNISPNLVAALDYARSVGARIAGITGRDGGYTAKVADVCVVVPTVNPAHITPHTEAFQAVIWHLFVSHPALKRAATKWESAAGRRAVFLDRDGVLNRAVVRDNKPFSPASLAELEIVPEAGAVLARLKEAGYLLIVVTNQPEVARRTITREQVAEINEALAAALPIDDFFVCPHDNEDACGCRKPLPGLLLEAAGRYGIDLPSSFMIGDRWRDIDAGAAAGCRTVLLDSGYNERSPSAAPDTRVASVREAAEWILASSPKS